MNAILYVLADLNSVCRFCLNTSSDLKQINEAVGNELVSFKEILKTLFREVIKPDECPEKACEECFNVIKSFMSLLFAYKQSTSVLEQLSKTAALNTSQDKGLLTLEKSLDEKSVEVSGNIQGMTYNVDEQTSIDTRRASCFMDDVKHTSQDCTGALNKVVENVIAVQKQVKSCLDNDQSELIFNCERCDCQQRFSNEKALFDHLKKQHQVDRPYKCQTCFKVYSSHGRLTSHMGKHTKPFQCTICLRHFANKQSLKAHKLYHEGGVKCAVCGHVCTSRGALAVHSRRHTGERPYACHVCGKMFPYVKNLELHMRTHYDDFEKDVCHLCGYASSIRSNFLKHVRRHSNEKKHMCTACGKSFVERCGLTKHVKKHCKGVIARKKTVKDTTGEFPAFISPPT